MGIVVVLEPSDASNLTSSISIDPSGDRILYPTILFLRSRASCGYSQTRYILDAFRLRDRFPKLLRRVE